MVPVTSPAIPKLYLSRRCIMDRVDAIHMYNDTLPEWQRTSRGTAEVHRIEGLRLVWLLDEVVEAVYANNGRPVTCEAGTKVDIDNGEVYLKHVEDTIGPFPSRLRLRSARLLAARIRVTDSDIRPLETSHLGTHCTAASSLVLRVVDPQDASKEAYLLLGMLGGVDMELSGQRLPYGDVMNGGEYLIAGQCLVSAHALPDCQCWFDHPQHGDAGLRVLGRRGQFQHVPIGAIPDLGEFCRRLLGTLARPGAVHCR